MKCNNAHSSTSALDIKLSVRDCEVTLHGILNRCSSKEKAVAAMEAE
jgi:osmotically-inducible protein OsmY